MRLCLCIIDHILNPPVELPTLRPPKCRCGERRVVACGLKVVGAVLGFLSVTVCDSPAMTSSSITKLQFHHRHALKLLLESPTLLRLGRKVSIWTCEFLVGLVNMIP